MKIQMSLKIATIVLGLLGPLWSVRADAPPAPAGDATGNNEGSPAKNQPMSLDADKQHSTPARESSGGAAAKSGIEEDELTEHQSVDSFSSLEDGQPGQPGEWEVQIDMGWRTHPDEHDPISLNMEIQKTLSGSEFLENTQLIIAVPLELGLGGVDGNGDVSLEWQQRWVRDNGSMPTLATLTEVRLPTGYHSSGVDGKITGIVAKEAGPGTLYFNAFAETANGDNVEDLRHFQWGFRAGYKWRIDEKLALIGDYVNQSSEEEGHANINALELSGMYKATEHLTVGPGILIGLDHNDETPNVGAGVRLMINF